MANAFQKTLQEFGLTKKILAVNADNATLNDMQTNKLDQLDNTFNKKNRVRCFNHTLQLSVKALLKPFNIGLSKKATDDDNNVTQDDNSDPVLFSALKSGPVRSFYHFWKRLRLRLVYILSLGPKDWTGPLWTSPYQSESSPKTGLTRSTCRPVSNQLKPVFGQFSTGLLL
jgi:hypothetical protein